MKYNNITISGQICTGKTTICYLLAKKLKWQTYSTGELFRHYAKKHNLSLEEADEQNDKLTKKIDNQVIENLKNKQHFIVDSWLAGIHAKKIPKILKILLVCKDDIRFKRFAKRENISSREAQTRVEKRFANWAEKIKNIYNRNDYFNQKYFDLVIDTSYIDPENILQKVLDRLCYKNHST